MILEERENVSQVKFQDHWRDFKDYGNADATLSAKVQVTEQ